MAQITYRQAAGDSAGFRRRVQTVGFDTVDELFSQWEDLVSAGGYDPGEHNLHFGNIPSTSFVVTRENFELQNLDDLAREGRLTLHTYTHRVCFRVREGTSTNWFTYCVFANQSFQSVFDNFMSRSGIDSGSFHYNGSIVEPDDSPGSIGLRGLPLLPGEGIQVDTNDPQSVADNTIVCTPIA